MNLRDLITDPAEIGQIDNLSKSLWSFLKFGGEQSPLDNTDLWKLMRVEIAQRFPGWTLQYIDALPREDVLNIVAVVETQEKLNEGEKPPAPRKDIRITVNSQDRDNLIRAIGKPLS